MKIITPIPTEMYLACSGGADSMFALHFLRRSGRKVTPIYFNHNTEFGNRCLEFLSKYDVIYDTLNSSKPKHLSQEEFWRIERYKFFSSFQDLPIITAHHLDDQIETMLMGFCHGRIRKIPQKRDNFIRPFLKVSKKEILAYCHRHGVEYLDDPSNFDVKYNRNRIRNNVVPELLKVNPGLYKSIQRLIDAN